MDNPNQFSKLTVFLHWVVALTIIGLLASGLYMSKTETWFLYPIHKSIGVLVLIFVFARVIWRIKNGWPKPAGIYSNIEQILAKAVHWILIVGSVSMPISGMVMSAMGGHGFGVFGLELVGSNLDPVNAGQVLPHSEFWASIGHEVHEIFGLVLIATVILHVVGALKHHIIDKDGTLRRMLGKKITIQD